MKYVVTLLSETLLRNRDYGPLSPAKHSSLPETQVMVLGESIGVQSPWICSLRCLSVSVTFLCQILRESWKTDSLNTMFRIASRYEKLLSHGMEHCHLLFCPFASRLISLAVLKILWICRGAEFTAYHVPSPLPPSWKACLSMLNLVHFGNVRPQWTKLRRVLRAFPLHRYNRHWLGPS